MVTAITGTTNKPVSSDRLKNYFSNHSELNGILYIGYPIIGTVEGAYPIDALWISPNHGLVIFNLIEGKEIDDYQDNQDDSYNKVEARLKGHRELMCKRKLQVNSVVFTGIYRAKGNEAAMVYVINAQDCFQSNNIYMLNSDNAKIRNRLFTAMTRSKAWVRVVGVGHQMAELKNEYEEVKSKDFTLNFVYPTEDQRKHLNIVNRDISRAEQENIAKRRQSVDDLLSDIEEGRIYPEDLGAEQVERLRKLLGLRRFE